MCTPLAKLAIGLWATMATGFYYLAAAPPASAQIDVCGPGNFSSACAPNNTPSPQSPASRSAAPQPATPATFPNIYVNQPAVRSRAIPEPGTSIALLLTGAGMICGCRKRNKQVGQQR